MSQKRKIQLIAGTTYSISLPKEWIRKNKLKEKDELSISERDDNTLEISEKEKKDNKIKEISLNLEDYTKNIDQILFALYYLGTEQIKIISDKDIDKETKNKIRKSFSHMSASEIIYEDKRQFILSTHIDISKINIHQIMQRISLIIDLSIENILEDVNKKEIKLNEAEIDRLYHLATKMITHSLIDQKTLYTSGIKNTLLIPSYLMICKKLENTGDTINHFATHIINTKTDPARYKSHLLTIKEEQKRIIQHITKDFPKIFEKIEDKRRKEIKKEIYKIEDKIASDYLKDILRATRDIEDELVQISFNTRLLKQKKV